MCALPKCTLIAKFVPKINILEIFSISLNQKIPYNFTRFFKIFKKIHSYIDSFSPKFTHFLTLFSQKLFIHGGFNNNIS